MSRAARGHGRILVASLAGLLVVMAAILFATRIRRQSPSSLENQTPSQNGFRELARESGIHFRMRFLPGEQGEKFKMNLYDHGCGVAVGDCDGDGHEDIYFVNQLGPNALYRNKGDGTFEDVTDRAGVALGDR